MASGSIKASEEGLWLQPYVYHNVALSDVITDLQHKYGSNFLVYVVLYDMADGTASGYYLFFRCTTFSSTTRSFKLA